MRSWILVVALAACAGGPKSSTLPSRSGETLWRLAPAKARVGVVVQGGALPELLVAADRWVALAELFPAARSTVRELRAAQQRAGLERFDRDTLLARSGLDVARPFAVFAGEEGTGEVLFVLPVADRAVWRRFAQARLEGGLDRLDQFVCAGDASLYVCAMGQASLETALAGAKDSSLARLHARVPAEVHGDVELIVDPGDAFAGPAPAGWIAPTVVAASLSLDEHGLAAHAWADLRLDGELADAAARPLADAALLGGASGVARLLLPRLLIEKAMADRQGAGAVVLELLTGEALWVTRGRALAGGSLHLFVRDASAAAQLLERFCRMGDRLRWTPGRCEMDYPAMNGLPAGTVVARVRDNAWVLSLGDDGPAGEAPALGRPDMRAIVEGPAHLAMWGVGLDLLAGLPDELRAQLPSLLPENLRPLLPGLELGSFLLASVYELGLRVGLDASGLRVDLLATTFAGAPGAAEHREALRLRARGDYTGYRAAMAAIGQAHPGSLLARQAAELEGRGPVVGLPGIALIGFTAAIAASSYEKYVGKARSEQARALVRELATRVEMFHAAHGALPEGQAVSAPRGSCCAKSCVVTGEPWTALGFSPGESVFTFEYERTSDGFRVRVVGDLDCDGEPSIFETGGVLDGGLVVDAEIYETQPSE